MATAIESDAWVLKTPAQRKLGVGRKKLEELISSGAIRVRRIPGAFARVSLSDVEKVLADAESLTPIERS